ncbi:MAG: phosphatase PAP2 family protein [Bacteroidales bacterium]|nr:phosphatase PAP2 family protein [Bacteroidales bacterium]
MNSKPIPNTIFSDSSFRLFSLLVVILLLVSSPLLFMEKGLPTFWINDYHAVFFDQFFFYITYLGDGLVLIPVLLFLLCRSYVWSGLFAVFTILEAGLVQLVLKKGFFAHLDRPSAYLPDFDQLHQVLGVPIHNLHTFPSGHTQTIFLVITFIALATKINKWMAILLVLIAVLTAISRVYLLQHFFMDIWFGTLIGFGLPIVSIYLWQRFGKFPSTQKKINCKNIRLKKV